VKPMDENDKQPVFDPEGVDQSALKADMSTYTQICYHIVFSTKSRTPVLHNANRPDLFRFIWGIVRSKGSRLYRINGVMDHVHLLSSQHPTCSLADFVKDIKIKSSLWIKEGNIFPGFTNWQAGYGAFTHNTDDRGPLTDYIKAQEEHHKTVSFRDELRSLLIEAGIEFDERFLV
jgi:putative transposase